MSCNDCNCKVNKLIPFTKTLQRKDVNGLLKACDRLSYISKFNLWNRILESKENEKYHDEAKEEINRLGKRLNKAYKGTNERWVKYE